MVISSSFLSSSSSSSSSAAYPLLFGRQGSAVGRGGRGEEREGGRGNQDCPAGDSMARLDAWEQKKEAGEQQEEEEDGGSKKKM